jgi:pilus assembly protein CpaE
MVDVPARVKVDIRNITLGRQLEDIIRSIGGFTIQKPDDTDGTDLLIVDLEDDGEQLQGLNAAIGRQAIGEVFLTSKTPDPRVLMEAMRAGAREFLPQPIREEEVVQALARFQQRRKRTDSRVPPTQGRVIDVLGSKGGVGTTTVAVNLAVSLAQRDDAHSVVLLDMNMLFGEIPLFLDIKPGFDWGDIAGNVSRLDETFLANILTKHTTGVHVLSSPGQLNGHPSPDTATIDHLIRLLRTMFSFVIVDGGHAIDPPCLKVLELSDVVLLVSVLSLPYLANTNKLLESFRYLGYPKIGQVRILLNRYLGKSEISMKDAETALGHHVFWTIPNDYRTATSAIDKGKALSQFAPKAQITQNMRQLADTLVHKNGDQRKGSRRVPKRT